MGPHVVQYMTALVLECMTMIDTLHAWTIKSLYGMRSYLRNIETFFHIYVLPTVHSQTHQPSLLHLPIDIAVPLYFIMEYYTPSPPNILGKKNPPTTQTGTNYLISRSTLPGRLTSDNHPIFPNIKKIAMLLLSPFLLLLISCLE